MAKVGGFDPNLGLTALRDGGQEIGRTNLPASARIIPGAAPSRPGELLFGTLSGSGLQERFAPYLAVEPRFRELLSPDVFFEAMESARQSFTGTDGEGGKDDGDGGTEEGPLVAAARQLEQILLDKTLCDMLRTLLLKA
ncbi:MAG: hypothetical protein LIP77_10370 [Planctomycetes bacterium]|nr:hypothetical protein [Planctomycetota bacterium]